MAKNQYSDSIPESQDSSNLQPHNAWIISPTGKRIVAVNISTEAATVWTRYGFRVEWFAGIVKAVA